MDAIKMSDFDCYKYGTRLIRVNEENKQFRDITPDRQQT